MTIPVDEWTHLGAVLDSEEHTLHMFIDGYHVAYRIDATDKAPTLYSDAFSVRGDEVTVGAARSTGAVTDAF